MLPPTLSDSSALAPRIDRVVTGGTCAIDGATWAVENNVWLVGDDQYVLVIDAAHDVDPILAGVGTRQVSAIVCTHGHADHVSAALALSVAVDAPVLLHSDDRELWEETHPGCRPDDYLAHGEILCVARLRIRVLETPGHTAGSVSLYVPELESVFTGDALVAGGLCVTDGVRSDTAAIVRSVRDQLLVLPVQTRVLPGHGKCTNVRAEAPRLQKWISQYL